MNLTHTCNRAAGSREPNRGISTWKSPAGKGVASGSCPAGDPRAPAGRVERGRLEEQRRDAVIVLEFLPYSESPHTSWLSVLAVRLFQMWLWILWDPKLRFVRFWNLGPCPVPNHSRQAKWKHEENVAFGTTLTWLWIQPAASTNLLDRSPHVFASVSYLWSGQNKAYLSGVKFLC